MRIAPGRRSAGIVVKTSAAIALANSAALAAEAVPVSASASAAVDLTRAPPPGAEVRWKPPIYVCIAAPSARLDPEIAAEMKATLPRAAQAWNEVTNAEITVLFAQAGGDCETGAGVRLSELRFVDGGAHIARGTLLAGVSSFAASDALGNKLARGGQLRFATDYPFNDRICGKDGVARPAACRLGDAVHEFGHLLGFRHDHISAAAPTCIDLKVSNERTDTAMSYYDAASVMNYCNVGRWRGQLSPADICSAQVAYPRFPNQRPDEADCYRLAASAPPPSGPP